MFISVPCLCNYSKFCSHRKSRSSFIKTLDETASTNVKDDGDSLARSLIFDKFGNRSNDNVFNYLNGNDDVNGIRQNSFTLVQEDEDIQKNNGSFGGKNISPNRKVILF